MADASIPIAGGWSFWRWICLRGAGFPAADVLSLAAPELAALSDQLLEAMDHEAKALSALHAAVAAAAGAEPQLRKPLRKLAEGKLPAKLESDQPALRTLHSALLEISARRQELEKQVAERFEVDRRRVSGALRKMAADPLYREALAWQNPHSFATGIDPLLRRPEGAADSETRRIEATMARYAQRYCLKNDAIGFFGPVGWGDIVGEGPAMTLLPGSSLVDDRRVYFEHWGVQALADRLAEDPELRLQLPPYRGPDKWIEGTTLHYGLGHTTELPLAFARLADRCDGRRTAEEIAASLLAMPELELDGSDEVYAMLEDLVERRIISWTLTVPADLDRPDQRLRERVEQFPDSSSRTQALHMLDELEAARARVAAAAGDAAAVQAALAELEATFTRLTEKQATRRGGKTYAGRTLVYEDCRRNVEVHLGPEMLERLAAPLDLILQSARWYTATIGARYRDRFEETFREMRQGSGGAPIEYRRFAERVAPYIVTSQYEPIPLVDEVVAELQRRWAEVLMLDHGQRRAERSVDQLRAAVADRFPALAPGWPSAVNHSPDIMVAASSVDAICRGDYQYVLGEIHTSTITMTLSIFLYAHPERAAVIEQLLRCYPQKRFHTFIPREEALRVRLLPEEYLPTTVESAGVNPPLLPPERYVQQHELVVDESDGEIVVRTRDGRHSLQLFEFYDSPMCTASISRFNILPPMPHLPRVNIGNLVIRRETWRFAPGDLPFLEGEGTLPRFVAVRRWQRSHDLPRFVFVRVPEEVKPQYVDFESPIYVDNFVKLVRKASSIAVSEMFPTHEQTWLVDGAGRRYTSELRFVAQDPIPWRNQRSTRMGRP
jgi:hypothetical protein